MKRAAQELLDDDRSLSAQIARCTGRAESSPARYGPASGFCKNRWRRAYRASHVPVREAFRRLEARGLLVAEPRRGVRVARLDPADVLEVAEMRAELETLALRHAMARIGPEDIARASAAIEDGTRQTELEGLEAANRRFHETITVPCGMPRLLATIGDLHRASARHLFATWQSLGWQAQSDSEHRAILHAIEARRSGVACKLLSAHVLDAGRALAKALKGAVSTPSGVVTKR